MKRKLLLVLVIIFIGIQFVPANLNKSSLEQKDDIIVTENPPQEIAVLLKTSCYDCHSNNSEYPWYDKVAPVSWWVAYHIDEAKEELNFSEWATFTSKRRNHKLEEMIEVLDEGEMPLSSYLIMHRDAKVSTEQAAQLKSWINTIKE